MKVNLSYAMDLDILKIVQAFVSLGWQQADEAIIEISTPQGPNKAVWISFWYEIMSYMDTEANNRLRYMVCPWVRGTVNVDEDSYEWTADFIKDKVYKDITFLYKPFYDEDAFKGIFKNQGHKENLVFYMNPDYPQGHWENHTLG